MFSVFDVIATHSKIALVMSEGCILRGHGTVLYQMQKTLTIAMNLCAVLITLQKYVRGEHVQV